MSIKSGYASNEKVDDTDIFLFGEILLKYVNTSSWLIKGPKAIEFIGYQKFTVVFLSPRAGWFWMNKN